MWILHLQVPQSVQQIQQQLAPAQESTEVVGERKDRLQEHHSNNSGHMQVYHGLLRASWGNILQHGERVGDGGEVREVKRLESHGPGGLQVVGYL